MNQGYDAHLTPEELTAKRRSLFLWTRYRMTTDEYNSLYEAQAGGCAICTRTGKLFVDHCHTTGIVRGLLCRYCNTGLGMFEDQPERLTRAIHYLSDRET